jgi:hypothetical protein
VRHAEFVAAYREGRIRVEIDPRAAAKFMSARLLLPLVMLPVLGLGVALALVGWLATGLSLLVAGILIPRLIKRSAPRFVLTQALEDETFYGEVTAAVILRIIKVA